MTPEQIRSQLKLYRVTVAQMARDLGIHYQTAQKSISNWQGYHRTRARIIDYVRSLEMASAA
jgi:hypothetical protein